MIVEAKWAKALKFEGEEREGLHNTWPRRPRRESNPPRHSLTSCRPHQRTTRARALGFHPELGASGCYRTASTTLLSQGWRCRESNPGPRSIQNILVHARSRSYGFRQPCHVCGFVTIRQPNVSPAHRLRGGCMVRVFDTSWSTRTPSPADGSRYESVNSAVVVGIW